MRSLPLLVFAAAAATASLQRRQDNSITIDSTTPSGSLCSSNTFSVSVSPDGNVVTLGFSEYTLGTPVGLTRGNCNIDLSLVYPPGCTMALMNIVIHGFFEGSENLTTYMDVAVSLSTGRELTGSEVFRNQGPTPGYFARRYPMDASISVNEGEPAEYTLSISLDAQIESIDEIGGSFTMDDITISFDTSLRDPDGQYCV